MPRVVAIAAAILIVAFIVWWACINRTVREKEPRGTASGRAARERGDARRGERGAGRRRAAESLAAARPTPRRTPQGSDRRIERATARDGAPARRTERRTGDTLRARAPSGPAVYTIHVASFKEMSRAEVEKAYLEKNGFAARIVEVEIKGERWLRILVGEYATEDEASKARLDLLGLNKIGYARIETIAAATR